MNSPVTHPGKSAALFAILALLSAAPAFADEKPLTEVRSPNFRVLTDGSDRQARRIAREFEEMRAIFAVAFTNMRLSTGAPLLIFAMQNERSMKSLAPAMWHDKGPKPAGLFQHGMGKAIRDCAPRPGRSRRVSGGLPRVRAQPAAHKFPVAAHLARRRTGGVLRQHQVRVQKVLRRRAEPAGQLP